MKDHKVLTPELIAVIYTERCEMKMKDFISRCTACGGNWTAMVITGIKELFPKTYEAMPDINYSFIDVCNIIEALGIKEE